MYIYIYKYTTYISHTYTYVYIYMHHYLWNTSILYLLICTLQRSLVCGAGTWGIIRASSTGSSSILCPSLPLSSPVSWSAKQMGHTTHVERSGCKAVQIFSISMSLMSLYVQTSQDDLFSWFFDVLTHVIAALLISHLIGSWVGHGAQNERLSKEITCFTQESPHLRGR